MANEKQQKRNKEQGIRNKSTTALPLTPYPLSLYNVALIGGIMLVTFLCYFHTLSNEFTNWDDPGYVYENPYLKNLTLDNMNMILFHDITQANYHPLTMLSLALNYHFSGLAPQAYYITQIILHLLNTLLVFILSSALFKAIVKRGYFTIHHSPFTIPILAGLCALWHGIHPMHVESVSWVSERKDVLYLFFYLAGLIFYVKYVNGEKIQWMKYVNIIPVVLFLWAASSFKKYSVQWTVFSSSFNVSIPLILFVLTLAFAAITFVAFRNKSRNMGLLYAGEMFLFAITAKGMAVVFPLSLLAIDILLKRPNFRKLLIEKIPLFIISLFFGVLAYMMQKQGDTISSFSVFTKIQRITFVSDNYLMYLFKFFVPTHLSAIYPYPYIDSDVSLSLFWYCTPFIAIAVTGGLIYIAYKGGENYFRVVLFGFLFYFVNVMFVLQFLSVGGVIMADRYTYASYPGFVFMLVYFLYVLWDKLPPEHSGRYAIYGGVGAFSLFLAFLCEARTTVWHDSKSLWENVIEQYPARTITFDDNKSKLIVPTGCEIAYINLGGYYADKSQFDSAYQDFEVLEQVNCKNARVYGNIGNIWALRGDLKKSLDAYTRALQLDSTGTHSFETYLDRGITYYKAGQFDLALKDFNRADKMRPNVEKLIENRAGVYMNGLKQYDSAIADYNRCIAIDPDEAELYLFRGTAEFQKNDFADAAADFSKNISMDPKSLVAMYDLSNAYRNLKDYKQALLYAQKARGMGYALPAGYIEVLQNGK